MPVQRSELEGRDDVITEYYDSIFWLFFENPDKAYRREEIEDWVSIPNWIIKLQLWPIQMKGSGSIYNLPIDVITLDGEKYYSAGKIDGETDLNNIVISLLVAFVFKKYNIISY